MTLRDTTTEIPELPSLNADITLLDTGDENSRIPLQTLAIDSVFLGGGEAVWVDSGHHAVTKSMAEIAPHRRVLNRIQVARGFTPYQHTSLLYELRCEADETTSVVVIPDIDFHYRSDEVRGTDGQTMLVRVLAQVARVASDYDVPVLLTREREDEFAAPIEAAAEATLKYRSTPMGPRFEGEEFETHFYDLGNGWVQTTFAFWQDILEAREPVYEGARAKREVAAGGAY